METPLPRVLAPSYHDPWPWQITPAPATARLPLPADFDPSEMLIRGSAHVENYEPSYDFETTPYVAPLTVPLHPLRRVDCRVVRPGRALKGTADVIVDR